MVLISCLSKILHYLNKISFCCPISKCSVNLLSHILVNISIVCIIKVSKFQWYCSVFSYFSFTLILVGNFPDKGCFSLLFLSGGDQSWSNNCTRASMCKGRRYSGDLICKDQRSREPCLSHGSAIGCQWNGAVRRRWKNLLEKRKTRADLPKRKAGLLMLL